MKYKELNVSVNNIEKSYNNLANYLSDIKPFLPEGAQKSIDSKLNDHLYTLRNLLEYGKPFRLVKETKKRRS